MKMSSNDNRSYIYVILDHDGVIQYSNVSSTYGSVIPEWNMDSYQPGEKFHEGITGNQVVFKDRMILNNKIYQIIVLDLIHSGHKLKYGNYVDLFSGLYTRNLWEEIIRNRISLPPASNYAVLMIDIDNLKEINDNFGHLMGDRAIKIVASSILQTLNANQIGIRYGGDEFIVILPDSKRNFANQIMNELNTNIERLVERKKFKLPVTISTGISFTRDIDQLRAALKRADHRMYQCKNLKRRCV